MNTQQINTIEDIFNDSLFIEIFDNHQNDIKEIESQGWSMKDIQEMANFIIKNS